MMTSTINRIFPSLKFFDVSIRDGLQRMDNIYSLGQKQMILRNIIYNFKPESMEIGSIVPLNNNIPQMKDSVKLYNYAKSIGGSDFYLWTFPDKKCIKKAKKNNIQNISFVTSASSLYQSHNFNQDSDTTHENIERILTDQHNFRKVKLYVSCVNKCPISNEYVKNEKIADEVFRYSKFSDIKEICLSDTTGTLNYDDFQSIMDDILLKMGPGRIGLHLHNTKMHQPEIDSIIMAAIYRGIYRFDISSTRGVGGWTYDSNENLYSTLNYNQMANCLLRHFK